MKKAQIKILSSTIFLLCGFLVLSGCNIFKPPKTSAPAPSPAAPSSSPIPPAGDEKTPDEKAIISGLITKGQGIKEMSYDMFIIGAGLSFESQAWLKDNMLKTDYILNGQRIISVFDLAKDEVISYLPGDKIATKMKMEEYQGQDGTTPLDYTQELAKTDFRLLGTETVNNLECMILKIIDVEGNNKMWLSTAYGLVVKVEEEDLQGQGVTIEFKNINIGEGSVFDNTFKIPEGIEVIDLNEMIENFS
jgi:outer membrane lipoprotein-sorting protein